MSNSSTLSCPSLLDPLPKRPKVEAVPRITPVIAPIVVRTTNFRINPFEIHLNMYKLPKRSIDSIAQTLIHELAHSAGYGHGDNKKKGKQNTVPYKIPKIAKKYLSRAC